MHCTFTFCTLSKMYRPDLQHYLFIQEIKNKISVIIKCFFIALRILKKKEEKKRRNVFRMDHQKWVVVVVVAAAFADVKGVAVQ